MKIEQLKALSPDQLFTELTNTNRIYNPYDAGENYLNIIVDAKGMPIFFHILNNYPDVAIELLNKLTDKQKQCIATQVRPSMYSGTMMYYSTAFPDLFECFINSYASKQDAQKALKMKQVSNSSVFKRACCCEASLELFFSQFEGDIDHLKEYILHITDEKKNRVIPFILTSGDPDTRLSRVRSILNLFVDQKKQVLKVITANKKNCYHTNFWTDLYAASKNSIKHQAYALLTGYLSDTDKAKVQEIVSDLKSKRKRKSDKSTLKSVQAQQEEMPVLSEYFVNGASIYMGMKATLNSLEEKKNQVESLTKQAKAKALFVSTDPQHFLNQRVCAMGGKIPRIQGKCAAKIARLEKCKKSASPELVSEYDNQNKQILETAEATYEEAKDTNQYVGGKMFAFMAARSLNQPSVNGQGNSDSSSQPGSSNDSDSDAEEVLESEFSFS